MTNSNDNFLIKSTMTYGLYVGIAFSLVVLIYNMTGSVYVPGNSSGLFNTIILSVSMLYFGRKFQREFYPDGITYKKALGFTVLLSTFASIIFAFFSYWYFKFIEPQAIQVFLSQLEILIAGASTVTPEQQDVVLQMYKGFLTPGSMAFGVGFNQAFVGVIFSLVISFFVKSPLHLNNYKQK